MIDLWYLERRKQEKHIELFPFHRTFIRFRILHSNWVRLNLSISCFIMVCLHGKVIVIVASQIFSLLSQLTFIRMVQELSFFLSNTIYYFRSTINPLHPDISMHTLHTILNILNTFPYVLAGRICLTVKRFFILITLMFDSGVILKGEIRR